MMDHHSAPRATSRAPARDVSAPDARLLAVAIVVGFASFVLGLRRGDAAAELIGGGLLAIVGLMATLALGHHQARRKRPREESARQVRDGLPQRPAAPRVGESLPPAAAMAALIAPLRASHAGDTRREQVLAQTLDRFVQGHGGETASHTLRVGKMSRELALLAGLPPEEADLLRQAAPLHDLGQAGIPAAILDKPGRFTAREFALMKKHTTLGYRILSRSDRPALKAAAVIALQHHERWDGMGYPQRLQGEEIHLHARIVGLVDAFDAMFCRRAYRRELSLEQALGIIRTQRGHHFDPRLHDLLLENLQRFTEILERHPEPPRVELPQPAAEPRQRAASRGRRAATRPDRCVPVGVGAPGHARDRGR